MAIFPAILCGGAGTRLWPASRPARPKPFLDLVGDRSLFQETVDRVAPLAEAGGEVIVVAGRDHQAHVAEQLDALGRQATLVLEPEGRDSGPAVAAAAIVMARRDPEAIGVFVASDHHIPDSEGFRAAIAEAVAGAAGDRIVTLGVRPTGPSSAYGYIQPVGPGLSPVRTFVEKPPRAQAEAFFARGFLWNCGIIVARARVLLQEFDRLAPVVSGAVRSAVRGWEGGPVVCLSAPFNRAPSVPVDRAILEQSDRVSVLPVDFAWSDLGTWDAVAEAGSAPRGMVIGAGIGGVFVRAAEGMVVAVAGVSRIAVIAERDAVLVCDLGHAQEVKGLVDEVGRIAPAHLRGGRPAGPPESVAGRFHDWVLLNALPLWATLGVDPDGGFVEALDRNGRAVGEFRRARVQTRQAYVYSAAGRAAWPGPWRSIVETGLERFEQTNLRADGLYRTRVSADGAPLDETAWLYDQAFALFAFAAAAEAGVAPDRMTRRARRLVGALDALRTEGGWKEAGDHPYQANAHMHLLEAFLAWEALDPDGGWHDLADSIVGLAFRAFIDRDGGFLREFFDAAWAPAPGEDGRLVEPGHQFEWAWLLTRWGRLRGDEHALAAARTLYAAGCKGVDARRNVALDALDDDLSVRSDGARLWPQTERIKAALILAETAVGEERSRLAGQARSAIAGLNAYLEPSGLWRDKMRPDGGFVDEPAPASSFYHIMVAWEQLRATAAVLPELGLTPD